MSKKALPCEGLFFGVDFRDYVIRKGFNYIFVYLLPLLRVILKYPQKFHTLFYYLKI